MSSSAIRRYSMPVMVVLALVALALVTLFPSKTDSLKQSRIALAAFERQVRQTEAPAEAAWEAFQKQKDNYARQNDYKALYASANQTYDTIDQVGKALAAIPIPKLHNTHARQAAWKALEDTRARYTMLAAAAQVWIKMAGTGRVDNDELIAIKGVEKQAAKYAGMIPGDFAMARQALVAAAEN